MLQDKRGKPSASNNVGMEGVVGKTFSRRVPGKIGFSRRSDRSYSMGSAADMMINDFDDERTLDEEEALEGSEDSHNELSNLQKESHMPLKELLAKYGYSQRSAENSDSSDQMNVMHGDERLLSEEKGENEVDEYEDEDEDEEDDEEAEEAEDDDDDEDDERNVANPKIAGDKGFKQLSLREFYVEMIKMDPKRMCLPGGNTGDSMDRENADESRNEADPEMNNRRGTVEGNPGEENDMSSLVNDEAASNIENPSARSGASSGGGGVGGGGGGGSSRLLRSVSRPQSEEEDDDCDYSPDEEEWKKTIMVGSDYQATIPEGLCKYDDALPYENEDKILWNPCFIPKEEVEEFLERAQLSNVKSGSALPTGGHVRDDEQALYLLLQCGYNLEEALRRRRMNVLPPTDSISLWSEEECHNFESGLRTYGKDFHLIQRNKVRTRSVGELVQFYYLWKKTERHDIFTYKARLEKKKYALHPGITDYMDRFLEEQEGVRDRSSSPNVNCLLYGDAKRQRGSTNTLANNHSEVKDTWDGITTDDSLGDLGNMTTTATTTTTTTTSTPGTATIGNSAVTNSSLVVPTSSSTSVPGTTATMATESSPDATSNTTTNRMPNVDGISTNHSHGTPRPSYSPSPETILSNLPP